MIEGTNNIYYHIGMNVHSASKGGINYVDILNQTGPDTRQCAVAIRRARIRRHDDSDDR